MTGDDLITGMSMSAAAGGLRDIRDELDIKYQKAHDDSQVRHLRWQIACINKMLCAYRLQEYAK